MAVYSIINDDVKTVLSKLSARSYRMLFMDPPDAIGLTYGAYNDRRTASEYLDWLYEVLQAATHAASIVWLSYNARWTFEVGSMVCSLQQARGLNAKACVQTFTFGQHNHHDLGNNHRPLIRLSYPDVEFYPDAVRVPSWRQEHGDKRADPRGRVPGDVFDFPRVTGNSRQRRTWHPTQLNEGLIERCIKLSCGTKDAVIDAFSGTGTTLRVCKRLGFSCLAIEIDPNYCNHISEENGVAIGKITLLENQ